MKDISYYLAKGFDQKMAEYFSSGRKTITSVTPEKGYSLLLHFDNGELRRLNCSSLIREGTVFEPFLDPKNFNRVYLDGDHNVCWDIDPNIDSSVVWNNKVDLSSDSCYVDSIPVEP